MNEDGFDKGIKGLISAIEKLNDTVQKLAKSISDSFGSGPQKQMAAFGKAQSDIIDKTKELTSEEEKLKRELNSDWSTDELNQFENDWENVIQKMKDREKAAKDSAASLSDLSKAENDVSESAKKGAETYSNYVDQIISSSGKIKEAAENTLNVDASPNTESVEKFTENAKDLIGSAKELAAAQNDAFGDKFQKQLERDIEKLEKKNLEYDKQIVKIQKLKDKIETLGKTGETSEQYIELEAQLTKIQGQIDKIISSQQNLVASGNQEEAEKLDDTLAGLFDTADKLRAKMEDIKLNPPDTAEYRQLENELFLANQQLETLETQSGNATAQLERMVEVARQLSGDEISRFESSLAEIEAQSANIVDRIRQQQDEYQILIGLYEKSEDALEKAKKAGDHATEQLEKANLERLISDINQLKNENESLLYQSAKLNEELDRLAIDPENAELMEELGDSAAGISVQLNNAAQSAREFNAEIRDAFDFGDEPEGKTGKLFSTLNSLREKAHSISQVLSDVSGRASSLIKTVGNLVSATIGGVKKTAVLARKSLLAMTYPLRKISTGFSKTNKNAMNLSSTVGGLHKRLLNLATAAFVFNVIRKSLRNLQDYMSSVLRTNNQFVASLALIKGNLLTAFQPIYEVILPALNVLMSALVTVTGYLSGLISFLFGKSASAASDAAKNLYDQAKAFGEVGKAADKAAGQLAGWDEINVLAAQNSEDAAGGSNVVYPDFDFDYSLIEDFFNKFATIPDAFYAIGKNIAEAIAKALGNIDWDDVKDKARTIAASIAEFINGFIDTPEFWYQIGRTIAEGINTAFVFVEEFADRLKWHELGQMIALGLNTLIDYLDPEQAARAVHKFVNGVFDAAYAAITETNWGELGKKIAIFLNDSISGIDWDQIGRTFGAAWNALINTLYAFITDFDWANFGTQIGIAVNGWFNEVNWTKVGKTLSDGVIGVLASINAFVRQVNWQEVGTSISEGISAIDFGGITASLWELIGGAIGALFSLLKGLFSGGAGSFNLGEYIRENVIESFRAGFTGATSNVTDTIQRFGDDISTETRKLIDPVIDLAEEATRKLTEIFITGKPVVAEDTATIANYFKTMADTAIDELERMRDSAIQNLAEIFGEEAVAYEENLRDVTKFYDDKIAELDRFEKELQNAVRNAKIQYGEESDEYAKAVREFEEFTSTKIDEIDKLSRLRDEELQNISENVDGELSEYARAREGLMGHYDEEVDIINTNQKDRNEALKKYLIDGEKLTEDSYDNLLDLLNGSHDDAIEAIVTNNAEQKSLKETWANDSEIIQKDEADAAIREAQRRKEELIDNAWEEYNDLYDKAMEFYDDLSEEDKKAIDDQLEEARRKKNDTIKIADEEYGKLLKQYNEFAGDIEDEQSKANGKLEKNLKKDWTSIIDDLKDLWKSFSSWLGDIWDGITSSSSSRGRSSIRGASTITPSGYYASDINIPKLATGAVIPPNSEFLAVLGDQKSGRNIEAPEGLIRDIVQGETASLYSALESLIDVLRSDRHITIEANGSAFLDVIQREQRRRGPNFVVSGSL